ncbi:MAG: erythromycin biosynthesis sensory transduction protein eryC1 [Chloroflexi bacterium]|nr:erythromycin biosynthesis sensory transduction protein eryC1 [Chloroflexota bacterium]|tara:strand:+ start:76 stop:1134 length:1059 start_codon:yes stop_codon:yes gene_type:complete
MKVPFFVQEFTQEMENAALDALRNEQFVGGESVVKFEEEFAKFIGTKYAVAVSSGNSALQLSLLAFGISNNSKVLTSTNSFIASANCIRMVNAYPVLADINPDDGNIDVKNINEKVDGIIPVHIYGNPCDFDSVKELAERQKVPIIEDACQAHGAIYKGKRVGAISDAGCFSFYPTKNMTVGGDGGMVTTDNEDTALKIRSLRDNGRKTKTEFDRLGFTMRLNTVSAAIGRVQLRHLNEKNSRRRKIASMYREKLNEDCILKENNDGESVYHQIVFHHKNRDEIRKKLAKDDIGSAIHYARPIHLESIYSEYNYQLPNSERFSKEIMSLPSYPSLTDEQVNYVSECMNEIIN